MIKVESVGGKTEVVPVKTAAEETPTEEISASANADETPKNSEALEAKDGDQNVMDDESDEKSEGEEKPKKKLNGFQRRINKLTSRANEKEREAEYWKSEALKQRDLVQPKAEAKKLAPEGKPQVDDFETHAEYVEALADWKVEQKLSARDQKSKEDAVKTEHQKKVENFVAKKAEFEKDHPDYEELMESVEDIPISLAVQTAILSSENGPELAYQLAKNREVYERICSLDVISAGIEIGKFVAGIQKPTSESKELKGSKAPAPINPVGSKSSGSKKSIFDSNLSQAEYEKLRMEQRSKQASAWG
jgi:hypothetical protein